MQMRIDKTGDWEKCGITLKRLAFKIFPFMEAKLLDKGEVVLQRLKSHIDAQDLNWAPLSNKTIALKGHSVIYVESGFLYDNLRVERVSSKLLSTSIFVGASPNVMHPTGITLNELMIYLEYGTHNAPPRPLIRPTLLEVKKLFRSDFMKYLQDFILKGRD